MNHDLNKHISLDEFCFNLQKANAEMRALIAELTMDLENEIDGRYGCDIRPSMRHQYNRDIAVCRRARKLLDNEG